MTGNASAEKIRAGGFVSQTYAISYPKYTCIFIYNILSYRPKLILWKITMSYYEIITCRLAIRVCIGYGPTGRKKHRTFSMKGINPSASWEGIMEVIRALAPVLEFPIVDIQKVTSRKIVFYEDAALPVFAPMEAELAGSVDSLDLEIAIWEERARKEQGKIALAMPAFSGTRIGVEPDSSPAKNKWRRLLCKISDSSNLAIRDPPMLPIGLPVYFASKRT